MRLCGRACAVSTCGTVLQVTLRSHNGAGQLAILGIVIRTSTIVGLVSIIVTALAGTVIRLGFGSL